MNVRRATEADRPALHALYREFMAEQPPLPYVGFRVEEGLSEIDKAVTDAIAIVAEDDAGEPIGFSVGRKKRDGVGYLSDLFVRAHARGQGVGRALMREVAAAFRERGFHHLTLNVDVGNAAARAIYERWGFEEETLYLNAPLDRLEARLEERPGAPSFGSIHVQTDDVAAVERAVNEFVPRLRGGSRGSVVSPPRNGWIAVYDELCDRDPKQLRRLARELSDRLGAVVLALGVEAGEAVGYVLLERGRVMDEYLSVPEYHGPLAPGVVVSLNANATLVGRLTGADPARVRAAAKTASSTTDLPPAPELLREIAAALGLEGGDHGFAEARAISGATTIERS